MERYTTGSKSQLELSAVCFPMAYVLCGNQSPHTVGCTDRAVCFVSWV